MKKISTSAIVIISLLLFNIKAYSQNYTLYKSNSTITVSGTSSLHDWDIISKDFNANILFKDFETAQIENLSVSIVSESLKSGKSAMDKKTYKALQTDDFKTITFKMVEVKSNKIIDEASFEIELIGNMKICGVSKQVPINFLLTRTNSGLNITGSCSMKMTDFNVEPPTALLGTIKTGDEISIKFNAEFKN